MLNNYSNLEPKLALKIKKSIIKPEITLDLHGITFLKAIDKANEFLVQSIQTKKRFISIITGIGVDGSGVLKDKIPIYILNNFKEKIVFIGTKPNNKGELLIYLKKSALNAS